MRSLRLVVKEVKKEDEGMNLVFMAYADFCSLAGQSSDGQQDSVRVILEVRHCLPPRDVSCDASAVAERLRGNALHETMRSWSHIYPAFCTHSPARSCAS